MDPHHHRYPHGVHLSALTERNSRRVWSDDASDAGEAVITNKNCSFLTTAVTRGTCMLYLTNLIKEEKYAACNYRSRRR